MPNRKKIKAHNKIVKEKTSLFNSDQKKNASVFFEIPERVELMNEIAEMTCNCVTCVCMKLEEFTCDQDEILEVTNKWNETKETSHRRLFEPVFILRLLQSSVFLD